MMDLTYVPERCGVLVQKTPKILIILSYKLMCAACYNPVQNYNYLVFSNRVMWSVKRIRFEYEFAIEYLLII